MELNKQHPQKDPAPARAKARASGISRRQHRGPLFDLPSVEPSQQAVYLKLLKGFHADGTGPDELDEMVVCRVLNDAYEPRRGFWRALEATTVLAAMACYAPDFWASRERTAPVVHMEFVRQIERLVFMLQFLERCAERLLDVPVQARSECEAGIWQWLHDDCGQRGETYWQGCLEDTGERLIKFVLRMVWAIERASASSPKNQPGRPRRGRAKRHPA